MLALQRTPEPQPTEILKPVLVSELRRKLGRAAFQVWKVLCARRTPDGWTHITRLGICRARGYAGLSPRATKKAMDRLRAAGLVRDEGWRTFRVPAGGSWATKTVYMRQVFGETGVLGGAVVANVPIPTRLWLQKVSGWGGRRVGSGRKRSAPLEKVQAKLPLEAVSMKSRPCANQEGPPKEYLHEVEVDSFGIYPAKKPPGEGPQPSSEVTPNGLRFGGSNGGGGPPSWDGMPPYPGPELLKPAVVPHPPRLKEGMSDLEMAEMLVKAFIGAAENRTKARCWVFRHGTIRGSKFYKTLVEGAKALLECDVPPAAWAAFSVDVWLKFEGGRKAPPVPWTFSPKRIEERMGWFEDALGSSLGGRVVFGVKAQDLLRRYAALRMQVAQTKDVKAAVERWFPAGCYARLLAEAQAESVEVQAHINKRIEHGDWLW